MAIHISKSRLLYILLPSMFFILDQSAEIKIGHHRDILNQVSCCLFFSVFVVVFLLVCFFLLFSEIFLDYSLTNQTGRYITLQSGFYEPISTQEMPQVSRTKIVIRNFPPTQPVIFVVCLEVSNSYQKHFLLASIVFLFGSTKIWATAKLRKLLLTSSNNFNSKGSEVYDHFIQQIFHSRLLGLWLVIDNLALGS